MDRWLVIGGAGYIGSHIVNELIRTNVECFVVDDLSTGQSSRLSSKVKFELFDAKDFEKLKCLITKNNITHVVHLAGKRNARESMLIPLDYWTSNIELTLSIIKSIRGTAVEVIIFSSSCSIYGNAGLVTQQTLVAPTSVYAKTKSVCEDILRDALKDTKIKLGILRYFNVIGASDQFDVIDSSKDAIIPTFVESISSSGTLDIFGSNFNTPDGTAIRDYIDVRDLVSAHILVGNNFKCSDEMYFESNVSTGNPISVLEIANQIVKAMGKDAEIRYCLRREGDPDAVWAEPDIRLTRLGWSVYYSVYESIASHIAAYERLSVKG